MGQRNALLSGLACSVVILACSGESGDASISPETACNDAASAICDKVEECAPFISTAVFADRATCVARFKINCVSSFSANGTSATPTRAAQCARDARSATCEDLVGRMPPETCRTLPGALEDGAVCGHDAQCKNKLCRLAQGSACGACSALGAAGGACERPDDCDHGLTCVDQRCIAYGKSGNACGAKAPCLPTLGCNDGICAAPLAAGARCTFRLNQNPCEAAKGFYCHPKDGVCVAIGTAAPGGQCELSLERVTACTGGAECKIASGSTTGPCVAPAADGAPCNDGEGPKCLGPARCTSGVCTVVDPASCK
ncbi:MAG: hypothetical protein KF764_18340 [Labilithrix sp.]|nr:hypothetical protein [Labilithrix sp.]